MMNSSLFSCRCCQSLWFTVSCSPHITIYTVTRTHRQLTINISLSSATVIRHSVPHLLSAQDTCALHTLVYVGGLTTAVHSSSCCLVQSTETNCWTQSHIINIQTELQLSLKLRPHPHQCLQLNTMTQTDQQEHSGSVCLSVCLCGCSILTQPVTSWTLDHCHHYNNHCINTHKLHQFYLLLVAAVDSQSDMTTDLDNTRL